MINSLLLSGKRDVCFSKKVSRERSGVLIIESFKGILVIKAILFQQSFEQLDRIGMFCPSMTKNPPLLARDNLHILRQLV